MSRRSSPSAFDIFAPSVNAIDKKLQSTMDARPHTAPALQGDQHNRIQSGIRPNSKQKHRPKSKHAHTVWRTPYKPPPHHSQPWDERFYLSHPLRPKELHVDPRDNWKKLPLMPLNDTNLKPITSLSTQPAVRSRQDTNSPSLLLPDAHNSSSDISNPRATNISLSPVISRPQTAPAGMPFLSPARSRSPYVDQSMSLLSPARSQSPYVDHAPVSSPKRPLSPNISTMPSITLSVNTTLLETKFTTQRVNSPKSSINRIAQNLAKLSMFSAIRSIVNSKLSAMKVLNFDLRAESVWKTMLEELRRASLLIRYEDMFFVGALKSPHRAILALMGFIATIIGIDSSWDSVQKCIEDKMLVLRNFLQNIKPLSIHPKKLKKAVQYWDNECVGLVEVETVSSICIPATYIARWAQQFQLIAHVLAFSDAQKILAVIPTTLPVISTSKCPHNTQQTQVQSSPASTLKPWQQPSPPPLIRDRMLKIKILLNSLIDQVLRPIDEIEASSAGHGSQLRWDINEETLPTTSVLESNDIDEFVHEES